MPAVFDGLAMQHDVTKLKLIDVKKFDSDAVWIGISVKSRGGKSSTIC